MRRGLWTKRTEEMAVTSKNNKGTWIGAWGGAAGIALSLTACAAEPGGTAAAGGQACEDETVRLAAVLPITGPVSDWGEGNRAVLDMLEKEVNESGGIDGRDLEIAIYDTGAKAVEAANLVRKAASEDAALAIMGPFTTSEAEVAFPAANQVGVVATSMASSAPGLAEENRPWAFRNTVNEAAYVGAVVPAMVQDTGAKKVAIAYDSADAIGSAIGMSIFPAVLPEAGLDVMNAEDPITFETTNVDLSTQVAAIGSMDPDAVGVGAFYNGAAKLLREMAKRGLETPIFGGSPLVSQNILDAAPSIPVFTAGTYFPGLEDASEWTQRASAALKEHGVSGSPTMFDASVYEVGQMYIDAIESSGLCDEDLSTAREGIRDYMASLDGFEGLTGKISMAETGDAVREFVVMRGQNGEWEVIARAEQ